jgi:hypothetical protein
MSLLFSFLISLLLISSWADFFTRLVHAGAYRLCDYVVAKAGIENCILVDSSRYIQVWLIDPIKTLPTINTTC